MTHKGTVKWFSSDNDKQDMFIHISALQTAGLDNLNDNQKIEYEIVEEKGKKSAGNIKLI